MDIGTLQSVIAIVATIVGATWFLGGRIADIRTEIADIRAETKANTKAIANLDSDVRELRGLLIAHISSHNHAVATPTPKIESTPNDSANQ